MNELNMDLGSQYRILVTNTHFIDTIFSYYNKTVTRKLKPGYGFSFLRLAGQKPLEADGYCSGEEGEFGSHFVIRLLYFKK